MCKARIEKAAKETDGMISANWDQETKMIEVKYDSSIVKAGHDTKMHKSSNETYDKLPGCCKYERMTQ